MNGKGSKRRQENTKQYRNNYDQINWGKKMPDLNIEYRYICPEWEDYCNCPPNIRKMMDKPACQYNEETADQPPVEDDTGAKLCPLCGTVLSVYRVGV